jgi:hypothetical protein
MMISHTLEYQQKRSTVVELDYRTDIKEGFELEPQGYYGCLEIVETYDGRTFWGAASHSSIDYYPISRDMYDVLKQHFESLEINKTTYVDGKVQ